MICLACALWPVYPAHTTAMTKRADRCANQKRADNVPTLPPWHSSTALSARDLSSTHCWKLAHSSGDCTNTMELKVGMKAFEHKRKARPVRAWSRVWLGTVFVPSGASASGLFGNKLSSRSAPPFSHQSSRAERNSSTLLSCTICSF